MNAQERVASQARTGLAYRDTFADFAHVPSDLVFEGADRTPPLVSIAITTFRRQDLINEAVESVLALDWDRPFELVVVDNDPDSKGAENLVQRLPKLRDSNFRYFVNRENIGLFPNHNRAIELARGEWVSILNDDDLLDPNFLTLMFAEIERHPQADGMICHKRIFDQRAGSTTQVVAKGAAQHLKRGINIASALRLLAGKQASRREFLNRAVDRFTFEYMYLGRLSRRVRPKTLFWGAVIGNCAGFLFRRDKALAVGGFYPEEFPSSDYWFFTRFAKRHHLRQHRAFAASMRKAENETAKPETVRSALQMGYALQKALAKGDVPHWWLRLSPLILAWHRGHFRRDWGAELGDREFENLLQVRSVKERPGTIIALRILLRAF
ncbi:MAG TPA: glycosyltransferase family 2 protein [Allosphingosinicella sp.]|nr:glycosyltransferase family 2 protein [Allosphingosinicella sp.]